MNRQLLLFTLIFSCLFVSCKDDETDDGVSNGTSTISKISGDLKIVERNTSENKYILKGDVTDEIDEIVIFSDADNIFSRQTINSKGKFDLELPIPSSSNLQNISEEFDGLTISDRTANMIQVWICSSKNGRRNGTIKKISAELDANISVTFVYVDKDVRITGSFNNAENSPVKTVEYDVHLKKGWNTVTVIENGEFWKYTANNESVNNIWAVEFFRTVTSDYHNGGDPFLK